MAQQTAVEWFIDAITESGHLWMTDKPNDMLELAKFIEQAKQMEKVNYEYSWIAGAEYSISLLKDKTLKESKESFEQYYNETFGKQ